jgi:sulfite reductase (NADPH) flavoprotein alpha-component
MTTSFLPDTAPFSPQQRAWLNGFFAAVLTGKSGRVADAAINTATPAGSAVAPAVDEDFPWHDAALPIADRMALAEGHTYARRLMAAMAQLDCGACGYLCQTYSEAIAKGDETDLTKCSPGGGETSKMLKQLVKLESTLLTAAPLPARPGAQEVATARPSATCEAPTYSRDYPFSARLVSSARLTHPDSSKDTRHVVIDLLDSGLTYEPGDSLGVMPLNCRDLVAEVLQALYQSGGETVRLPSGRKTSLRDALMGEFTLGRCGRNVFSLLAEHAQDQQEKQMLQELLSAESNPLATADLAEVLARFSSARPPIGDLLAALAKLQPRLYSISSSQKAHPNEVHLTVGVVQFESLGRRRGGVASNFLGVRSLPGDEVRVFVQRSPRFRLPADPKTPLIMVGPGTGIAPFRAFLEEREATGAAGKSWLFFGNQHIDFDFLYRQELSRFLDSGVLTKLTLAFSRDTAEKVYVQHGMLEHGAELWRWLEEGANFYVCGDAKRMAIDVDQALQSIVAIHGQLSPQAAKAYVQQLVKDKRYHKDVY